MIRAVISRRSVTEASFALFKHFILHLSQLPSVSGRQQCQYQCKNARGNKGPADNRVMNGLRTSYNEVAWKNFSQHLAVACPVYTNKVLETKYHSGRGYQRFSHIGRIHDF